MPLDDVEEHLKNAFSKGLLDQWLRLSAAKKRFKVNIKGKKLSFAELVHHIKNKEISNSSSDSNTAEFSSDQFHQKPRKPRFHNENNIRRQRDRIRKPFFHIGPHFCSPNQPQYNHSNNSSPQNQFQNYQPRPQVNPSYNFTWKLNIYEWTHPLEKFGTSISNHFTEPRSIADRVQKSPVTFSFEEEGKASTWWPRKSRNNSKNEKQLGLRSKSCSQTRFHNSNHSRLQAVEKNNQSWFLVSDLYSK